MTTRNHPLNPKRRTKLYPLHVCGAGLIVTSLLESILPDSSPEKRSLIQRAEEMNLPKNPLVRPETCLNPDRILLVCPKISLGPAGEL